METIQQYSQEIKTCLQTIENVHGTDTRRTRVLCRELLQAGNELQDDYLLGFAYCYLAESYFIDNRRSEFNENLVIGIEHQLRVNANTIYSNLAEFYLENGEKEKAYQSYEKPSQMTFLYEKI